MEDRYHAFDGAPARLEIPDIALDKLDPPGESGEVLLFSCREVVEDPNGVSPIDERFGDVRADEARSSRDQILRHSYGT